MSGSRSMRRTVVALAAVAAAGLSLGLGAGSSATAAETSTPNGPTIPIQLLSFNDFHGNLESGGNQVVGYQSTGTGSRPNTLTVPAGGVAYLASHLAKAREGHPYSVTVAAGDIIGASPFLSAAFHDEPTIEAMNALGLEVTSVGNHEFDEGATELLRMQDGGCLADGPEGANNQNSCPGAGKSFAGSKFQYLAANVVRDSDGSTLLPPYWVKQFNGAKVGFIGMTLKGTPEIVTKGGIAGLSFKDEVATANALVPVLREQGVKAIVVLLHQGGVPVYKKDGFSLTPPADFTCDGGANALAQDSAVLPIAQNLDPAIDVIISGHTHQPYVCDVKDPAANDRLLTSASSFGKLFTDIELSYDRRTQDIVRGSVTGRNNVVDRTSVQPDPAETGIINYYKPFAAPIANRKLGYISSDVKRAVGPFNAPTSGESPLGDLIADAQREDPSVQSQGSVQIAFMNPGGIRADLSYAQDASDGDAEGDGVVTFGEAFSVQPFNNYDVSMELTGAQIEALLEQQFLGNNAGPNNWKILQVSNGFSYTYDTRGGAGNYIDPSTIKLNGVTLDPATTYRVECNSFLSDGGDGFGTFAAGRNKLFGGLDIDALARFLSAHTTASSPYSAPPPNRISHTG